MQSFLIDRITVGSRWFDHVDPSMSISTVVAVFEEDGAEFAVLKSDHLYTNADGTQWYQRKVRPVSELLKNGQPSTFREERWAEYIKDIPAEGFNIHGGNLLCPTCHTSSVSGW